MKQLTEAHVDDLRRDARRFQRHPPPLDTQRRETTAPRAPITIRRATAADAAGLRRVAELASLPVPAAPVVLAEVGGELRVAVSLADGATIADPFHHTAAIVELVRASVAHDLEDRGGRLRRRLRRVVIGRARNSPQTEDTRVAHQLRHDRIRAEA